MLAAHQSGAPDHRRRRSRTGPATTNTASIRRFRHVAARPARLRHGDAAVPETSSSACATTCSSDQGSEGAHELDQRRTSRTTMRSPRSWRAPRRPAHGSSASSCRSSEAGRAPRARSTRWRRSCSRLVSPGVPDFYQGTELWALSLVDPDNRRPVDYAQPRARCWRSWSRGSRIPRRANPGGKGGRWIVELADRLAGRADQAVRDDLRATVAAGGSRPVSARRVPCRSMPR